jgi:hypothetical protein
MTSPAERLMVRAARRRDPRAAERLEQAIRDLRIGVILTKRAAAMMDGRQAAAQIQRAVSAEVLAGYGTVEIPLAALRSASVTLAALTHASDIRVVEAAVANEFIERASLQLRGICDARIGARLREVVSAVRQNFPIVH